MKTSKILSVAPIFNSDPASVYIELSCSLCDEVDTLVVNQPERAGDISWLRRNDFYFVCGRHRKWESKLKRHARLTVSWCMFTERATGSSMGESPEPILIWRDDQ